MYTKNDILLESAFFGDIVKIDVATDMMCESYIDLLYNAEDEETFNEAGAGIVGSIVKMIGSSIGRVIKFLQDRIAGIKKSAGMKKILKSMEPETKEAVLKVKSKEKVKFPDVAKAEKLLDQAEKGMSVMVSKVSSSVAAMDSMSPAKKVRETEKLNTYVETSIDKISGIYSTVEAVLSSPIEVPVGVAYKYMDRGIDLTKRCETLEKELSKYGAELTKSIQKINLSAEAIKEAAEVDMDLSDSDDIFESYDDEDLYEERKKTAEEQIVNAANDELESAGRVKTAISKTVNGISSFVHSHAKAVAVIIASSAVFAGGVVLYKNAYPETKAMIKNAPKNAGGAVSSAGKTVVRKARSTGLAENMRKNAQYKKDSKIMEDMIKNGMFKDKKPAGKLQVLKNLATFKKES